MIYYWYLYDNIFFYLAQKFPGRIQIRIRIQDGKNDPQNRKSSFFSNNKQN